MTDQINNIIKDLMNARDKIKDYCDLTNNPIILVDSFLLIKKAIRNLENISKK